MKKKPLIDEQDNNYEWKNCKRREHKSNEHSLSISWHGFLFTIINNWKNYTFDP